MKHLTVLFLDEKVKPEDLLLEITRVTFSFGAPTYLPNWIYFHLILSYQFPTRNTYFWRNVSIIVSLSQAMQRCRTTLFCHLLYSPRKISYSWTIALFPSPPACTKKKNRISWGHVTKSVNMTTISSFRFEFTFFFLFFCCQMPLATSLQKINLEFMKIGRTLFEGKIKFFSLERRTQ